MNSARNTKVASIQNARDTGGIAMSAAVIEHMRIEHSALSVASRSKRSTFRDCRFSNLTGRSNVVGNPVFERCTFEGIVSQDQLTLYAALFLECRMQGVLAGVTFGFDGRGIYPREAIKQNIEAALRAPYCLDVTEADLKDVAFQGGEIASKVRFRPGQCLILSAPHLAQRLLPMIQTTEKEAFAELLAPSACSEEHMVNLAVVPQELKSELPEWISKIEALGVEVRTSPLC
jgi:hypothetical protein